MGMTDLAGGIGPASTPLFPEHQVSSPRSRRRIQEHTDPERSCGRTLTCDRLPKSEVTSVKGVSRDDVKAVELSEAVAIGGVKSVVDITMPYPYVHKLISVQA